MADPGVVSRTKSIVSSVAGRAMWISGFAYYEIGRNGFARFHDTAYLIGMTMAFGFGVLAACACLLQAANARRTTAVFRRIVLEFGVSARAVAPSLVVICVHMCGVPLSRRSFAR
jgi:hypothetical protein